jgi:serine/threonine protein kinase
MVGLLATGGMAEVYLALSGDLIGFRTLVVVKRILPHLASNKDFIRMFFDEARIVALLDHPNIVRIIEVGQDRDEYFLAMDLVQGKPLSAVIRKSLKQGTPLSQPQAAFLVAQAANGLGHAHGMVDAAGLPLNIVHRDVSPQNILVSYAGAVKVIDFGVARVMGRSSVTKPGGLKGKIHYMAPEQAASGRVDRRSDVFALGVVLWEAICGRRPFRRESEIETLRAVVEESIPPPSKFVRVPARLESIVMRALERNPANRFQTAQEMALALERYAFASPEFNPAQISTIMKDLFASDVTRWKKTLATVKTMEGEPEQWTNTSGTYLHPEGIDLTTRGMTVALHPVPQTPRPLVSTQEIPSVGPSLPSIGFNFSVPIRIKRRRVVVVGALALGVASLVSGWLAFGRRSPSVSEARSAPAERSTGAERSGPAEKLRAGMRVEALPRPSLPTMPASKSLAAGLGSPTASAVVSVHADPNLAVSNDEPPPLGALPSLAPHATMVVEGVEDGSGAMPAGPAAGRGEPPPVTPASLAFARKRIGYRPIVAPNVADRDIWQPAPQAGEKKTPTRLLERSDATAEGVARAVNKGPRRPADQQCFVRVGSKPWSELWIDGKNTNLHTPYSRNIACGRHTLTFKRPDLHLVKTFKVTAVPGDTLMQSFSLRDE